MSILKKTAGKTPAPSRVPSEGRRRASRAGALSSALTAAAVAAVLVFNLVLAQLPDTVTQFDLTDSGIYRITDTTVDYLSGVTEDVALHVLARKDGVDSRIVRFLAKYEDLSERLSVEYIDPVAHPSALSTYNCAADTIAVTCAATGRQETVNLSDIIGIDEMAYFYYGQTTETDFDAEGLLTSAVDGVLTSASHKVCAVSGHGETALPDSVTEQMEKLHLSVSAVNLLTDGGVPEECELLILNAPTQDLASDELDMLLAYLAEGGQVVCCLSAQAQETPRLDSLCQAYGITPVEGVIADLDRCYQNNLYLFFPTADPSVDAAAGVSADATILFYASRGMRVDAPARDTITVSPFLTTSANSYAVVGDTPQSQGTYTVGAVATEQVDDVHTARLTVYGSDSLVNADVLGSFSNVGNVQLFLSSITCAFEDVSSFGIEPVSLTDPANTIPTAGLWALVFIFVIPAAILLTGFIRWMRRRKL